MATNSHTQLPWSEYRRRRRWFFIVFLTYVPGVGVIGYSLSALVGSDIAFPVVAGFWMLAFAVAAVRMSSFPCPKCHRPFFHRLWVGNPLAEECIHCGFQKWGEIEHDSDVAS